MPFRKPCHMPFHKLIPPFTLTAGNHDIHSQIQTCSYSGPGISKKTNETKVISPQWKSLLRLKQVKENHLPNPVRKHLQKYKPQEEELITQCMEQTIFITSKCMTQSGKTKFAQWKCRILHALHKLRKMRARKTSVVQADSQVTFRTITSSGLISPVTNYARN